MQPRLAHFSIRASDLDRSARFYIETFGFEAGHRPPFDFDGRWLYLRGQPVLHLIGGRVHMAVREDFLDRKARAEVARGSGALDHVALSLPASELDAFTARLDALGVEHSHRTVPISGYHQIFVEDPDGVTIEVLFDE